MATVLITGSSGFIGFHLTKKLLNEGTNVLGFDNENDYYDISLKVDRRKALEKYNNFKFYRGNLENYTDIQKVFKENKIDKVVNLAAQVGVRYSIKNPFAYIQTNIVGFHNILDLSKEYKVQNFVYTSSSSVYGNNEKHLLSIEDTIDKPISLYATTKRSNELMAYSYSHSFGLQTIGLRLFTVYGPWGRPDMAIFKFAEKIKNGDTIDVYNYGKMKRDFTYIDDIVDGIYKAISHSAKYDLFNLGNHNPVELEYIITLLEKNLGKKAIKNYLPLQPGDMLETNADIKYTTETLGWEPKFSIEEGIKEFVNRFNDYYGKSKNNKYNN